MESNRSTNFSDQNKAPKATGIKYAIILPGWGSWGLEWSIAPLPKLLRQQGFTTKIYRNYDAFNSIADQAEQLHVELSKLNPNDEIYLVGHSMGGLLARQYEYQYHKGVKALVCISTPHEGCKKARLAPWSGSATDMVPDSLFLRSLGVPLCSAFNIFGRFDEVVWPVSSLQSGFDKNLAVNHSHLSIVFSSKVAMTITDFMLDIARRPIYNSN